MTNLYQQLQTRSFVKLAVIDNIAALVEELDSLDLTLNPYTVQQGDKITAPLDLYVTSLIDRSQNPAVGSQGWNMRVDSQHSDIVETTLAAKAPKIMKAIYQLFDAKWITRAKISRLPPNSNMLMHSHAYLNRPGSNNEVVVHIALKTNSGVEAVVLKDGVMEKQHCATGEVWYLNTLYPHKFQNNGTSDRYHLWINLKWHIKGVESEKLSAMVSAALST